MNQTCPPPGRILMAVILQMLKDGPAVAQEEIELNAAARCDPSSPTRDRVRPDETSRLWLRAVRQSMAHLRELGLVYQADPGAFRATDLGKAVAAQNPAQISRTWLRRGFPEFIHWEYRQAHGNFPSPTAPRAPLVIQRRGRRLLQVVYQFFIGLMLALPAFDSLQDVEVYAGF